MMYAARHHFGQTRKGTARPYFAHVLGVASIVLENGGDEDQAMAALLHDVPEDCGGRPRLAEIRRQFGPRVARIVDGCTDTYETPKPPWLARKKAYIARVGREPAYMRLVSAADKFHNVREVLFDHHEVGEQVWLRFQGGKEGTLWYYREIVKAFRRAGSNPLVERLAGLVAELQDAATQSSKPTVRRAARR